MRILMAQRFDVVNVGCAERIWRQAEELARRGHAVTLVNFPHAERRRSIPAMRAETPPGVELMRLDRKGSSLRENIRQISAAAQNCDLLHLWKAYPDIAIPSLFAVTGDTSRNRRNLPLHYDWDDLEGGAGGVAARYTGSRLTGFLTGFWEREILHWCDTLSVSSQAIHELAAGMGYPEERIFPGPVGAEPSAEAVSPSSKPVKQPGRHWLVFLGQLEGEDFPPSVLDGIAEVLRSYPDVDLLLIGDGHARRDLEAAVLERGIADRTQFTGYLPREEAQHLLSQADVFLFPLRDDLMSRCKSPLVVIEAMSHGIPIAASDVGEAPRMLGGLGALVRGFDKRAWAEALRRLLDDPVEACKQGAALRQRFLEEWTWKRSVDHLEQAYLAAVESARNRK